MTQIGSGIGVAQLIQFFGGELGVTMSGLLLALQESLSYRRARLKQPKLTSSLLE